MAERERKRKPEASKERETPQDSTIAAVGSVATNEAAQHGRELVKEMDGVLDEIDEVLEVNAEEFVRSYVQKGGE
jgi:ubiquitin-like protein Pup